ncbi:MAG: hypothetical protein QOK15_3638 [Nocardioidaceae bacterium]|jgi:MFS superfamily sulfate permease-like transporter|nr:hypothetical protein [Nocardioidaceae bacterium]
MAKSGKQGRISQLIQAYRLTRKADPKIGVILLGTFLAAAVIGFVVLWLVPPHWLVVDIITAVLIGLLAALVVFGRRATKSQLKQIEGKPGAAAAVLGMLRRGWHTDQAIAFNRQQDVVHRLVGPPGIVLIGEGNANRLRTLMSAERTRHQRVASETPIHEILVGNDAGEVPLGKLTRHVTRMKRQVQPAQITDILARLKALDSQRSNIPVPKGPMPTSMKGLRGNLRGR